MASAMVTTPASASAAGPAPSSFGRDVADDLVDQAGARGTPRPASARPPAAPRGTPRSYRAGAAARQVDPAVRAGADLRGGRDPGRARRRRGPGRRRGTPGASRPRPAAAAGWPGCRRAGCATVSCGSSASTVPTPTMIASTVGAQPVHVGPRLRRGDPLLVPSAAAERPSRVAANFQITYGRPRRDRRSARRRCRRPPRRARTPDLDLDPGGPQRLRAAGGDRVGVGHGDHDPGDAGRDQRLGAGAGAAGVVAGLQGDHGGAAPGPLAGLRQARRPRRAARRRTRGSPRRRPRRRRRASRSRPRGWGWCCRGRGRRARWHARIAASSAWRSPCVLASARVCSTRGRARRDGRRAAPGCGYAQAGHRRRRAEPDTGSRALSPIRTVDRRLLERRHQIHRSTGCRPGRGLTAARRRDHRRFGISPSPASAWWVRNPSLAHRPATVPVRHRDACHRLPRRLRRRLQRGFVTGLPRLRRGLSHGPRHGAVRCAGPPPRTSRAGFFATDFISVATGDDLARVGVAARRRRTAPPRSRG